MNKKKLSLLPLIFFGTSLFASDLKLWYNKPSPKWVVNALPIGNGRLGSVILGGIEKERLQFNEESLWIGDEKSTGAYQAFGDIWVEIDHGREKISDYRRELDIERSVHTITYKADEVQFRREAFASYPDQVIVYLFTASKPGQLNGTVQLTDSHGGTVQSGKNDLFSSGNTVGYIFQKDAPYELFLDYRAQVRVIADGGTLTNNGDKIAFSKVTQLMLLLDARTNYVQDRRQGWRGTISSHQISEHLDKLATHSYAELLQRHVEDYQRLFNRMSIDLGPEIDLPTNERLKNASDTGIQDLGLNSLVYQYGRYLMISSSRKGGLPANLQGIWNDTNTPKWRGDFHTDINIEMNYWAADVANLSECFSPFAQWLNSIRDVRKEDTYNQFKTRGWAMKAENGIFGGSTWMWVLSGSAWCMQNIYNHYTYTQDKDYLKKIAYPMMKEVCEFWLDRLKVLPDGSMVAPLGYSPEHGPKKTDGVAHDQQLIWDLFTNTIEAASILNIDADFSANIAIHRDKLSGPKIGKWGQLQEWMEDIDDPKDHHRHLSHLVGLYPGRQISVKNTPELAKAARISLDARGDASTGWSSAWKICLWARLQDGERANQIVKNMLHYTENTSTNYEKGGGLYPNLLAAHPPFQIDANFGYVAGVSEMLVQSSLEDGITLLPALPKAWRSGCVKGLRARGGFTVDVSWHDHQVTSYRISSAEFREVKLTQAGQTKIIKSEIQP